jgi:hypothetical protein
VNLCLVRLLVLSVLAGAASAIVAPGSPPGTQRTVAVVHLHQAGLHSVTAQPTIHSGPETAPGPAATSSHLPMRPLFHPSGPLMRPILPWWLHRRHLAAPQQSSIA